MRFFLTTLGYEWGKVFHNKKFRLLLCGLLLLNLAVLWYQMLPDEYTPGSESYREIEKDIEGLEEEEKVRTLTEYAENISEDTLKYTDNIEKETSLVEEILEEVKMVLSYPEFLQSVQNQAQILSGVSIFKEQCGDGYSERNIRKTNEDYKEMGKITPSYEPSKAVTTALDTGITDVLAILVLCMAVYILICYEKEKNLHCIIRGTIHGRTDTGVAKFIAMELSCLMIAAVFYVERLLYCFITLPRADLTKPLQSLAPYMASTLQISIGGYLLLFIIMKAMAYMVVGGILMILAIVCEHLVLPYLCIGAAFGAGYLMCVHIMATSKWAVLKYINFVGMLDISEVFGQYLNLNLFGQPKGHRGIWIGVTVGGILLVGCLAVLLYSRVRVTRIKSIRWNKRKFEPHTSLVRHEAYKIFIMKKGILILLLFLFATGFVYSKHQYYISGGEELYRQYMERLSGPLDFEKETYLLKEKQRFEEAQEGCEEIDALYYEGKISRLEAMNRKEEYESILNYREVFDAVYEKYEFIKEHPESEFIYDTGYRRLFSTEDESTRVTLYIYMAAMIFTLAAVFAMEHVNAQYKILYPTLAGRKKICHTKIFISSLVAVFYMAVSIGWRVCHIMKYYKLPSMGAKAISIFGTSHWGAGLSIGTVLAIYGGGLLLLSIAIMAVILFFSSRVKNTIYTIVLSVVTAAVCIVVL